MHISSRQRVSLNGEWGLEIDVLDAGRDQKIYECRTETPEGRPENFDVTAFRRVAVPGDWNRQFSELAYYEGVAWYHHKVSRPAGWAGKRAFLYFEGANYETTVYWNGEELGTHEGGFTPFYFEVTGKIESQNTLVVRVDSRRRTDALPSDRYDWFNYGGITRSVWLVYSPKNYIKDFIVTTEVGKKQTFATIDFEVVGGDKGERARVLIPELKVEVPTKLGPGGKGQVKIDISAVTLWTPQKPRMYKIEVACGGDRISDEIGFRSIERKGEKLLLNGQPLFLRGVCVHEEAPRTAGRTMHERDIEFIFKTARSLGANFLRLVHYPHTEQMARNADKSGMLLWEEIPVYKACDFKSKRTLGVAKNMLAELIERDRNRASVIAWSVANETPETPERSRFLKDLVKTSKALDPSRPVAAAMFAKRNKKSMTVKDPLSKIVDIVGINEYIGWYEEAATAAASIKWKSEAKRPVIVTEFGAAARAGLRGKVTERWTEDYQEALFNAQLDMAEKISFLVGTTPWVLFDFRSPVRMNRHQQGYNRKGLVSDQGVRKLAFQVVRDRYEAWRKKYEGK